MSYLHNKRTLTEEEYHYWKTQVKKVGFLEYGQAPQEFWEEFYVLKYALFGIVIGAPLVAVHEGFSIILGISICIAIMMMAIEGRSMFKYRKVKANHQRYNQRLLNNLIRANDYQEFRQLMNSNS